MHRWVKELRLVPRGNVSRQSPLDDAHVIMQAVKGPKVDNLRRLRGELDAKANVKKETLTRAEMKVQMKATEIKKLLDELKEAKEDLGKVIGKQGRTARAMRTILSASSTKLNKRSVLEIIE